MWVAFAKATHIFFSKNTLELDIILTRTVNILTTNEIVKLTMLWTTGPWMILLARAGWIWNCAFLHARTHFFAWCGPYEPQDEKTYPMISASSKDSYQSDQSICWAFCTQPSIKGLFRLPAKIPIRLCLGLIWIFVERKVSKGTFSYIAGFIILIK